jgi:glycosyltransferase involved in cell wall biosynthesis
MIALGLSELLATFVADRTVLVSPQTRRWMPWVKAVIPNGIDEQIFAPGEADRAAVPTIVFVGTYRNRKRGQLLMDVFRDEVRAAVPAARLIMVCEDAPPAEGVTVTGRITDSELAGLYRYAWVFCLPSSYEGFGIPYAEALSSGTPVVATENPGARFVLNEGRYGYLVTEKQLGSQLIAILSDPDVREEAMAMAAAGSGKYRMTEVIQKYEELYGG